MNLTRLNHLLDGMGTGDLALMLALGPCLLVWCSGLAAVEIIKSWHVSLDRWLWSLQLRAWARAVPGTLDRLSKEL